MDTKSALEKKINEFLSNRSSGAEELAKEELNLLKAMLKSEYDEQSLHIFIKRAADQFPQMAPILRIKESFRNNTVNPSNIDKLEEIFSDRSYVEHIKFLFEDSVSILTFSNSSSVRNVLVRYTNYVQKVLCSHSLPLGEGATLVKFLQERHLDATLIEDAEASIFLPKINFVLTGADSITENFFINKIGTLQLALLCQYLEKPFYVVASQAKIIPLKLGMLQSKSLGNYFEKVDNKLVTKFII
jgi:translation initiation factor 2B subunit (eIF-2B alpha/beta/delta family)